jgi:16S rRNA A1518/A1519 N6-dimethyltransferase RsmA/KsgA/DIM1 with predicted DNA glycosylase/AP lyase activity
MSLERSVAKHPDLIYDVGMHTSEDTEFYLKKGFRVVAFEADPELAQRCREKFSAAIEQNRLVIVEGAIVNVEAAGRRDRVIREARV